MTPERRARYREHWGELNRGYQACREIAALEIGDKVPTDLLDKTISDAVLSVPDDAWAAFEKEVWND